MDYYKILGVEKTATQDDIKKAYKTQAMKHHPDRGGDSAIFTQVNEAYETLKDPNKRAQYDNPPQERINVNAQTFEDIFGAFGFNFGRQQQVRKNKDIRLAVTIDLRDVALGKDLIASYKMSNGTENTATIRIHQGVEHGEVIRFRGLGDNAMHQYPRGDLLVQVRILKHPRFDRDGMHLSTNLDVSVFDLMLGTAYVIDKLTGGGINVNIPKGTQPGTTLSIPGYGLPDLKTGRTGNLYVKIKGKIPKIDDESILERIKDLNATINRGS